MQTSRPPLLRTNLDTNLLKLVAILSMTLDHFGAAFFPGAPWMRWIGRMAFPLFCYCMTVGLLYTRDIRKYLGRLAVFAVVSQPFYLLAFHPYDWRTEWANWNIFFTLFLSLLAMVGLKARKWWLFLLGLFVVSWWNFDYSGLGIQLMLIFYLCRNRPKLGAVLFCLTYATSLLYGDPGDPLTLDKAEQYVPLLAQLVHQETHSIYGSGVFDYPKWKAAADARRHLGQN